MADDELVKPVEEGHIPETSDSVMEDAWIFTLSVSYDKLTSMAISSHKYA